MIGQFKDKYSWLSNMTPFEKPFKYDGIYYRTNEHFYVAMKTQVRKLRYHVSMIKSPGAVKKLGRTFVLREDWDEIKLKVMHLGLQYKFSINNPKLRQKLIATGTEHLQEGNYWNDTYWGVTLKTNEGENHLGKLLMQVRDEINRTKGE